MIFPRIKFALRTGQPYLQLTVTARASTTSTAAAPNPSDESKLKFCIVGSGPAGLYTLDRLLKTFGNSIHVDVLDRLPTPFGLVRSGVAPDHQDTKNVINQFTGVARDPRASFFGNVALGRDVSLQELRALYHGVVLAYGAESDKKLGIPGEGARNVFSAREFVWWYNGHPDGRHLPVDLRGVRSVAICGIGNVALDCARVLLQPANKLAVTDVAAHAMKHIQEHGKGVRDVHLLARRGPVQAACTPKELRELVGQPELAVHAPPTQMEVSVSDQAEMKKTRMRRRVYDLIKQAADGTSGAQGTRQLHFQFYRSPKEVLVDSEGAVSGVRVEVTQLADVEGKGKVAVATGRTEVIPAQLLLVSIGYRALSLPGVPFDDARAVVPNEAGRVPLHLVEAAAAAAVKTAAAAQALPHPTCPPGEAGLPARTGETYAPQPQQQQQQQGAVVAGGLDLCGGGGVYVVGWLKRGPTGIIGTNAVDADETVACIAQDVQSGGLGWSLQATDHNSSSSGGSGSGGGTGSELQGSSQVDGGAVHGIGSCSRTSGQVARRGGAVPKAGSQGLRALLAQRGDAAAPICVVDFGGWEQLDATERAAGQQGGKVREKVVVVEEMLELVHSAQKKR